MSLLFSLTDSICYKSPALLRITFTAQPYLYHGALTERAIYSAVLMIPLCCFVCLTKVFLFSFLFTVRRCFYIFYFMRAAAPRQLEFIILMTLTNDQERRFVVQYPKDWKMYLCLFRISSFYYVCGFLLFYFGSMVATLHSFVSTVFHKFRQLLHLSLPTCTVLHSLVTSQCVLVPFSAFFYFYRVCVVKIITRALWFNLNTMLTVTKTSRLYQNCESDQTKDI